MYFEINNITNAINNLSFFFIFPVTWPNCKKKKNTKPSEELQN